MLILYPGRYLRISCYWKSICPFWAKYKNDDGTLNRKALGKIVFSDEEKLKELNNLTHPRIREK